MLCISVVTIPLKDRSLNLEIECTGGKPSPLFPQCFWSGHVFTFVVSAPPLSIAAVRYIHTCAKMQLSKAYNSLKKQCTIENLCFIEYTWANGKLHGPRDGGSGQGELSRVRGVASWPEEGRGADHQKKIQRSWGPVWRVHEKTFDLVAQGRGSSWGEFAEDNVGHGRKTWCLSCLMHEYFIQCVSEARLRSFEWGSSWAKIV